ncbi:MAG TPA: hypothetical protein VHW00_13470 [Thermoanaerobaculia bacterium]|nr:hypothetical protein [Thermoanaerobaculia bacterium]
MDCPKCGAQQAEEREECASCGIVFDRWRRAQDEAELRRRNAQNAPLPVIEQGIPVPWWLIAVAVAAICVVGTMWTIRRREERAKIDYKALGKAQINQINKDGMKVRQRLSDEMERAERLRYEEEQRRSSELQYEASTAPRQFSLTEGEVMTALFPCAELREQRIIRLPKEYNADYRSSTFESYPELLAAQRSRLLITSVENGIVRHTIGVTGGIIISDVGDHFEVPLGQKRIDGVKDMTGDADRVTATFNWNYDQRVSAEVLLGVRSPTGKADFLRQNGVWRMTHATLSEARVAHPICVERAGL